MLVLAAACGSGPNGPTPTVVRVTSISPTSGSTFGGTAVTISGENFAAGATVTIGGTAPTSIVVVNDRTITATTVAHASGAADVVVNVAGKTASLPGGFTFAAPTVGPNTPPTIQSLRAQGTRANEPPQFADLGESIAATATVTDLESAVEQLTFEWSASIGTIDGTGPAVTYRAPASLLQTPADASVTVTVVEKYLEVGEGGLPVEREHRVSQTIVVRVHDSATEINDLGEEFLTLFSDSSLPAVRVVEQFTDECGGKFAEMEDVEKDHKANQILSYNIGNASPLTIGFGGVCTIADRVRPADACAYFPVRWVTRNRTTGVTRVEEGTDMVTAVYLQKRWYLCDSDYIPSKSSSSSR